MENSQSLLGLLAGFEDCYTEWEEKLVGDNGALPLPSPHFCLNEMPMRYTQIFIHVKDSLSWKYWKGKDNVEFSARNNTISEKIYADPLSCPSSVHYVCAWNADWHGSNNWRSSPHLWAWHAVCLNDLPDWPWSSVHNLLQVNKLMINLQFIAMLYGTEVLRFLHGCACIICTTFKLTPTFRT